MDKPMMPKLVQGDDESNLDFSLRQAAAKREYKAAMKRWREQGGTLPAPAAAEAADAKEEDSTNRRKYIDETMKEMGQ